jgi:hypothetical protein
MSHPVAGLPDWMSRPRMGMLLARLSSRAGPVARLRQGHVVWCILCWSAAARSARVTQTLKAAHEGISSQESATPATCLSGSPSAPRGGLPGL